MAIIEVSNVTHCYNTGLEKVEVLRDISLSIDSGDLISIQGRSGSGKSTLLNLIGGFIKPSSGSVTVNKLRLNDMTENELSKYRRNHVGFVFQSYHLFQNMNALENVEEPLFYMGVKKKERKALAINMLEKVGLGDRLNHQSHQLSGGQQQRVSIARALVANPTLILADEPTGNLDSNTEEEVLQLLLHINKNLGKTIVMVTHEEHIAKLANRKFIMNDGKLNEQ